MARPDSAFWTARVRWREKAVAVEDVVAEHQRARLAGDELLADGERLRQAVRRGLLGVGEVHAVARAVPEQALEVGGGPSAWR